MKYKLKPGVESFEVVDGPFAGKKYFRGKLYDKVPPGEKKKFEEVRDQKSEVGDQEADKKPDTRNLTPDTSKATERSKP